jgi:hypothetical protein
MLLGFSMLKLYLEAENQSKESCTGGKNTIAKYTVVNKRESSC